MPTTSPGVVAGGSKSDAERYVDVDDEVDDDDDDALFGAVVSDTESDCGSICCICLRITSAMYMAACRGESPSPPDGGAEGDGGSLMVMVQCSVFSALCVLCVFDSGGFGSSGLVLKKAFSHDGFARFFRFSRWVIIGTDSLRSHYLTVISVSKFRRRIIFSKLRNPSRRRR
jgi:hypothetical protein